MEAQQCVELTNTNRSRAYPNNVYSADTACMQQLICYVVSFVSSFEGANLSPFGGDGGGEPHVPISNTTVKPSSADGTCSAGSRESRTSPGEQPCGC